MRDLIPVLNLLGHRQESLLDVRRILRRSLQEWDAQLVRKFLQEPRNPLAEFQTAPTDAHLCRTVLNDLLACKVGLVAHKQLVDTFRRIAIDLLQPLLDVRESVCRCRYMSRLLPLSSQWRTVVGNVIYYNDTVCSTVVRRGDGAETLLA